MTELATYRQKARQLRGLATGAVSERARHILLTMAGAYDRLARRLLPGSAANDNRI